MVRWAIKYICNIRVSSYASILGCCREKGYGYGTEYRLKYDAPFFDMCLSGKRPFHAYWRATLEYFGIAKRYLRAPEQICGDEQMKEIQTFFENLNLKPS